jgi:hypothetical protein
MVDGGEHQRKPRLLSTGASSSSHRKVTSKGLIPPRRSDCIPKHKSPHRLSKKCWALSKKMQSILQF